MKSYSSETKWGALWREARCLYQNHKLRASSRIDRYFAELGRHEEMVERRFGRKIQDMEILEIGPGPFLVHMRYFSQRNRVTGIDLDVVPHGFGLNQYWRMWRQNGTRRTLKTIIRKAIGIDRHYHREVRKRLGSHADSNLRVLQMDACEIEFPDASFDLVHSRSVFHHIPDPSAALKQIGRILKPGGIAIFSFHLYTSENGSLDPRVFTDSRSAVSAWPHLRKSAQSEVHSNAYVNKLRLGAWLEKIGQAMPGSQITLSQNQRPGILEEAELLVKSELSDYSLEELLTDEVSVVWQKP